MTDNAISELSQDWYSIIEAAKIISIDRGTLREKCRDGVVDAKSVECDVSPNGKKWLVSRESVKMLYETRMARKNGNGNGSADGDETKEELLEKLEDWSLSHAQANRLERIQRLRKLKLKNDVDAGKMVNIQEIRDDIQVCLGLLLDDMRSCIDSWALKYGLPAAQLKKLQGDFNKTLKGTKRKLYKMVKECKKK